MLENDYAMGEAMQLEVSLGGGLIIKEKDGARAPVEKLLHRQDLAAEAERIARYESHLRE